MLINTEIKQVTIEPGTGLTRVENNSFIIYPNPNDGSFSIDLGKVFSKVVVTITAPDGRIIQREERENAQLIGLNMIASSGIYLVTITSGNERAVFKMVRN
jgi:hypothetical protein